MNKNLFLLSVIFLNASCNAALTMDKGYEKLDKLFIFAANNALSCYKLDGQKMIGRNHS